MSAMQQHPFEPLIFPDAHILILGSFPSLASFEEGFYYAHPRNQFWPLLAEVFGTELCTKEAKIELCRQEKLGLWDSAKSLKRETGNSSDANLKAIEVNDFKKLLMDYPGIKLILFTGKKAEQIFNSRYKELKVRKALLPSSSPAYAAMRFEQKLERYKELLKSSQGFE
ncbi:MAG: DNA-deoxyinosine glycosylase [Campylobacterales bacterium]|nr:DNA-deoxyinosine glycosylase [Campylobacterales bacterium]